MDTRQLLAFQMLADVGSFTGAAKNLYLTPSAISHSMKALEQDLGCRLLRRHGKKVSLTDAGQHMLTVIRPILQRMEHLRDELEGYEKFGAGRLRIGSSHKNGEVLLPQIIGRFREDFPRFRFQVQSADTRGCLEMLRTNQIDLAITLEPTKSDEMEFLPWFSDELQLVVPPGHPWIERGWLNKVEVDSQNFILGNKSSYTFSLIMDYLKQEDLKISSFVEMSNVDAVKELIKSGFGIGVLATWTVRKEVEAKELHTVRIGRRRLFRTWGVSSPPGRSLNAPELAFARIGEEVGCKWMMNHAGLGST